MKRIFKNNEVKFLLKVVRNALILSGLYFISVWATSDLNWYLCKPILIFLFSYVLIECAKRYQVYGHQNPKVKKGSSTLIL